MPKFDSLGFLPNEIFEKFSINNFSILRDSLFLRNIKYNDGGTILNILWAGWHPDTISDPRILETLSLIQLG